MTNPVAAEFTVTDIEDSRLAIDTTAIDRAAGSTVVSKTIPGGLCADIEVVLGASSLERYQAAVHTIRGAVEASVHAQLPDAQLNWSETRLRELRVR